jgi:hypothetical protein
MSFKRNSNCELLFLLLKSTSYIAKIVNDHFLFIILILVFVDMYTNILKIKLYKNKSICSFVLFLQFKRYN